MDLTQRFAVIMAGGSGERFWPLSRRLRPKQFLTVGDATTTMLEASIERLSPLFPADRVVISAAPHLLQPLLDTFPQLKPESVIAEPAKRNTAGCLTWVTAKLLAQGVEPENLVLAIVTADHRIEPKERFQETIQAALTIAETSDHLVTIGIKPTRPDTGYGYIEADFQAPIKVGCNAYRVQRFHEKPSLELAQDYLTREDFYWNSGMFFWRVSSFLTELAVTAPKHHALLLLIADALRQGNQSQAEKLFCELPDISIDYALMERARNVAVVEATFDWDDLGTWDSLERYMEKDVRGNSSNGEAVLLQTADCMVHNASKGLTVCLLGAYDLLVVATDDAVLICNRDQAQSVREVVAELKARGIEKV